MSSIGGIGPALQLPGPQVQVDPAQARPSPFPTVGGGAANNWGTAAPAPAPARAPVPSYGFSFTGGGSLGAGSEGCTGIGSLFDSFGSGSADDISTIFGDMFGQGDSAW